MTSGVDLHLRAERFRVLVVGAAPHSIDERLEAVGPSALFVDSVPHAPMFGVLGVDLRCGLEPAAWTQPVARQLDDDDRLSTPAAWFGARICMR